MTCPGTILPPDDDAYRGAERVVRRLRSEGFQALLAGGCVRDLLLGRRPKDYDVATDARPEEVVVLFERVLVVGRQFGVCRVDLGGRRYEVATFRREEAYSDGRHPDAVEFCGPRLDALRRDFTVNAMFWDPLENRLLDYVGGRPDLEARLLRTVGVAEERFGEDHLRVMRAVRFAARFDLAIHEDTRRALLSLAHLAVEVSPERLQDELRGILTDLNPARALRLMDELGILAHVFPEVDRTRGCEQPPNYHPEGDVFVHSILTVEKLGAHPAFELAMSALLHDVGKPEAVRRGKEPMRFPLHDRIGVAMAERVCRRLRLSTAETDRICWLIGRHHYFMHARDMRDSTLKKLFAHPGFEQLAALVRADALASWGVLRDYEFVMSRRASMPPEEIEPPPLITGRDLTEMGFEPGPLFGEVLAEVRDAQLDGDVSTRQDALELARRLAGGKA